MLWRRRRDHEPESYVEWWTQPTPRSCDALLHQVGLDPLRGNDVDRLAELLLAPADMPERERIVLPLRFGLDRGGVPRTIPEITTEVGVAELRISQVLEEALDKVRAHYADAPPLT